MNHADTESTAPAPEDLTAAVASTAHQASETVESPPEVQASEPASEELLSVVVDLTAKPEPVGEAVSPTSEAVATESMADEPVAAETVSDEAVVAESVASETVATEGEPAKPAAAKPAKAPVDPAVLAARKARAAAAWDRVVAAKTSGETQTGTVTAAVKGGVLVDVGGIRGFLPGSQIRLAAETPVESLLKTKIPLKVIDVDATRRRIVVSHRRALDDERRAKRAALLASLVVGEVREGTVARLADFGAFVDLGGIDGLIPMRELALERGEIVEDVLKPGDKVNVEILRIEEGGKKISLSRKNALPDPWRDHAELLRPGGKAEGTVVSKDPRLEVEIAPGIVGTIREGDANPADYEIGEKVEVVVRFADRRLRRIGLSTAIAAAAAAAAAPARRGPVPLTPPTPGPAGEESTSYSTASGFAPLGVEKSVWAKLLQQ